MSKEPHPNNYVNEKRLETPLKQPKCKTCGDTKRSYYIRDTMDGEEKVGIPCPDCQQPTVGE